MIQSYFGRSTTSLGNKLTSRIISTYSEQELRSLKKVQKEKVEEMKQKTKYYMAKTLIERYETEDLTHSQMEIVNGANDEKTRAYGPAEHDEPLHWERFDMQTSVHNSTRKLISLTHMLMTICKTTK